MSESDSNSTSLPNLAASKPEELPPVEPPSAGFIIQLFVVPALIVASVIGIWLLFGKAAESKTDWKQLVAELGSSNEHRRWRAALELAQRLQNERLSPGEDPGLAQNNDVAVALCDLLEENLASPSTQQDDIDHREFLTRALESLDCNETVLPTLAKTLSAERDIKVRKSGLRSVIMIAGRAFDSAAKTNGATEMTTGTTETVTRLEAPLSEATIANETVVKELRLASQDEDPSIRQHAAFAFGLVSGPDVEKRLRSMLLDRDNLTRANAAVGLARNGIPAGEALIELLEEQIEDIQRDDFPTLSEEEQQLALQQIQFVRPTVLRSCLRAAGSIYAVVPEDQQSKLKTLFQQLTKDQDGGVRSEAVAVLDNISKTD